VEKRGKAGFNHQNSPSKKKRQKKVKLGPQPRSLQPPKPSKSCPQCKSLLLFRDGKRRLSDGSSIQRYLCRTCGYRFSANDYSKPFYSSLSNGFKCQIGATPEAHGQLVENLAEVKPLRKGLAGATTQLTDTKSKLLEYAWWLKKNGKSDSTIEGRTKLLRIMVKRGANLYDPETVKDVIAKQPWCNGRKNNACDAYS
jgi:DNA-directed RNA polymerase subunit M/transcription elongation factor TFIIS